MVIKTFCINNILKEPEFIETVWETDSFNHREDYNKILESFISRKEKAPIKYLVLTDDMEDHEDWIKWAQKKNVPVLNEKLPQVVNTEELYGEILDELFK
jgi:hypothetical protein